MVGIDEILQESRVDLTLPPQALNQVIAHYDTVLSSAAGSGSRSTAYYGRGRARMLMRQFLEAIADFDAAIELDPTDVRAHFDRLWTLMRIGRFTEVVKDCDGIIKRFPTSIAVFMVRAAAFYHMHHYEKSIDDYCLVIALSSKTNNVVFNLHGGTIHQAAVVAYQNRAKVYELLGERELALADLERARRCA